VNDYPKIASDLSFQDDDDDNENDSDDSWPKIQTTTAIMAAEMSNHFELKFNDNVVVALVQYGGQVSDGNVVAVLSI